MGKIPEIEEERIKRAIWMGPSYYDYPDGEDLGGKIKFAAITSGAAGLALGSFVASGVKEVPKSFSGKLVRTAQVFVPIFGVAIIFTTVTYYSTRLRKKDDEYNYVIGGLASGLFLRSVTPHFQYALLGSLIFPTLGFFKKHYKMQGRTITGNPTKRHLPIYFQRKWDTSLLSERKGNWTRE